MTNNNSHSHEEPVAAPAMPTVPDSFRVQALERRVMALTNEKFVLENRITDAEATNLFNADVIDALKRQLQAGPGDVVGFIDGVEVDTLDKYLANDVDLGESPAAAMMRKLRELASAESGEGS
jgi:hypothetical protein